MLRKNKQSFFFDNFLLQHLEKNLPDHDSIVVSRTGDHGIDIDTLGNLIVLYVYDYFVYDIDVSVDTTKEYLLSNTVRDIHNIALIYPDKNFILVTENEFSEREFNQLEKLSNLHVIATNYFLTLELDNYTKLTPERNKNVTDTTFMCLNRHHRMQRFFCVCYLFYKRLENHGIISYGSSDTGTVETNNSTLDMWSSPTHNKITRFLSTIKQNQNYRFNQYQFLIEHAYEKFKKPDHLCNSSNFDYNLRKHYSKSYVEIITMTASISPSFSLDEKYINSVFGFVFPIIVGSHKHVELIRDFGFDVFDDIIDHSYDNEPNPYYRIKYAIDLNNKLLRDREFLEEKFTECIPRFEANVRHYKENLKGILQSRVQQQLDTITF